jgi:hypothetical protein
LCQEDGLDLIEVIGVRGIEIKTSLCSVLAQKARDTALKSCSSVSFEKNDDEADYLHHVWVKGKEVIFFLLNFR